MVNSIWDSVYDSISNSVRIPIHISVRNLVYKNIENYLKEVYND